MRAHLTLAFLGIAAAACGGRSIQDDADGTTAGGGSGPSGSSQGGTKMNAGASGGPGTAGGGGTSGSASGGTAGSGGGCSCLDFDCGPDSKPVPNADGCCFHCEPICGSACPPLACRPGDELRMLPGWCCPMCFASPCGPQQLTYYDVRKLFLENYSTTGCTTDADCAHFYEKNQCTIGCGISVPTSIIAHLDETLRSIAAATCDPNCATTIPHCEPLAPPTCFQNRCQ